MTDFERINTPRVEKLIAMIDVISKSAKSQRVEPDQVSVLMEPARAAMAKFAGPAPVEVGEPVSASSNAPRSHHTELLHLCRTAPLQEAVDALSVIAARVDQELFEATGGKSS